jgi:hypothetical protein
VQSVRRWESATRGEDRRPHDDDSPRIDDRTQDPNMKGLVPTGHDPGGLLEGALSAAFPAGRRRGVEQRQIAESKATFKAAPEYYIRRGGLNREEAARRDQERATGGAGQRGLASRARSSPVHCKTTSARS